MNVMSRLLLISVVMCAFFSCKNAEKKVARDFNIVEVETILQDSLLNVRALEINKGNIVIATSNGNTMIMKESSNEFVTLFKRDTIHKPNFRALACAGESVFTISIANPGLLYKGGILVYKEVHEKVFYDSIDFWNDNEGIAIGDQTNGCMSIIVTRDGGNTWKKQSCEIAPKVIEGEAAFAASDTNIKIIGDNTWVATGGMASRILYSPNKGKTWKVYETPIVQGVVSSGMYSIDFYDENIGFAIGGDYIQPDANELNKIKTIDGGMTWELVGVGQNPGYRSCVQFIPNNNGVALVAVGFNGVDYSKDFGNTWKHLSDEEFYTIRFLNDSIAYAAGKGRVSRLKFK